MVVIVLVVNVVELGDRGTVVLAVLVEGKSL